MSSLATILSITAAHSTSTYSLADLYFPYKPKKKLLRSRKEAGKQPQCMCLDLDNISLRPHPPLIGLEETWRCSLPNKSFLSIRHTSYKHPGKGEATVAHLPGLGKILGMNKIYDTIIEASCSSSIHPPVDNARLKTK